MTATQIYYVPKYDRIISVTVDMDKESVFYYSRKHGFLRCGLLNLIASIHEYDYVLLGEL